VRRRGSSAGPISLRHGLFRYGVFWYDMCSEQPHLRREAVRPAASSDTSWMEEKGEVPIYDFKCEDCGQVSEILVRNSDDTTQCPGCGGVNVQRLIAAASVIRMDGPTPGHTCCGREERCEAPPCSTGDTCYRQ